MSSQGPSLEWQPDPSLLHSFSEALSQGGSASNAVQAKVMEVVQAMQQRPDYPNYLVHVFASDSASLPVRQMAGLQLKALLYRKDSMKQLQPGQVNHIKTAIVVGIKDRSSEIRQVAGSCISGLVSQVGPGHWVDGFSALAQALESSNQDEISGALSALQKVCEDTCEMWKQAQTYDPDDPPVSPQKLDEYFTFFKHAEKELLPKFFAVCRNEGAPSPFRVVGLDCINQFGLNGVFHPSAPLGHLTHEYVQLLGEMATSNDGGIIKRVCRGFTAVSNEQPHLFDAQTLGIVMKFMLQASKHAEYEVRAEALEFWPAITGMISTMACPEAQAYEQLGGLLPELLPLLLDNMVYSERDYLGLDAEVLDEQDNSQVPDRAEDIKPQFHAGRDDDEEEEEEGQTTWGSEWTARKSAALALDHIASAYRGDVLPTLLPLLEGRLSGSAGGWEIQESGVLAIGAIAHGCMSELAPHLHKVLPILLRVAQDPSSKPLLRSICCWALSRFAGFVVFSEAQGHGGLGPVVECLLGRMMDGNKRVQEAACSSFATLEEEAGETMKVYLEKVVDTFKNAFKYYQQKNFLILLDAVGSLFESARESMRNPKFVEALFPTILSRCSDLHAKDKSLISIFECLSSILINAGDLVEARYVQMAVERALGVVHFQVRATQTWKNSDGSADKPDKDLLTAAVDMISSSVEGLREMAESVLTPVRFESSSLAEILCALCQDFGFVHPSTGQAAYALSVRQAAFALVGDLTKYCMAGQKDGAVFPRQAALALLPILSSHLASMSRHFSVCNNAAWAVGEISVKLGAETFSPHAEEVGKQLLTLLRGVMQMRPMLKHNLAISMGRVAGVCPAVLAPELFKEFLEPWGLAARDMRNDQEKMVAIAGVLECVKANPQGAVQSERGLLRLVDVVGSFYPPPPQLAPRMKEMLEGYKQLLGDQVWRDNVWGYLEPTRRYALNDMYRLMPDEPPMSGEVQPPPPLGA